MKKIRQALKYILSFAIPFTVCMMCFGVVWFQYLQEVPLKSRTVLLNDRYDSLTSPLEDGQVFSQEVSLMGPVYGFGINFNVIDPSLDGVLKVSMYNKDSGEKLLDFENSFEAISQTSYTCFALDTPLTEYSTYNLEINIQADYTTQGVVHGQMLSLKKSSEQKEGFGKFTEGGKSAEGSLAMLVITDIIGNRPVKYFFYTGLVCSIAAGILMLILVCAPKKQTLAVFLTLIFVCFVYQLVLPTYSAPDEITHYNTAYNISNSIFGIEDNTGNGVLMRRETDNSSVFTDYKTSAFTYRYIMHNFGKSAGDKNGMEVQQGEYLGGYKAPYILSALSISLGRILNLNGVTTAMLARIPNILLFCLMVTLAWRLAPTGKTGILAAALLPMTIHTATSVSYDSLTISFAFILIALCLKLAVGEEKTDAKNMVLTAVICIIFAPMKSSYILMAMLVLLISYDKFNSKKQAWRYKFAVLTASFLHFGKYNLYFLKNIFKTANTVSAAETAAVVETVVNTAVSVQNFTVGYMLAHPGVMLKMVINTFFTNFTFYLNSMIGGALGYLNLSEVNINPVITASFALILLIAFIPYKDEKLLCAKQRFISLFIFVLTLCMIIAVCITWTPMDYNYIWGFQGRYLIPILPLFFLGVQSKAITRNKDLTSLMLYCLFALNIFAVLNSFIVIFAR